jgi:hypothetical protein
MRKSWQGISLVLAAMIAIGTLAGLLAVGRRFSAEMRNRRVEIGVEYAELDTLAQASGQPLPRILEQFNAEHVSAVILSEDTVVTLEQTGAIRQGRIALPGGDTRPAIEVYNETTLERIRQALKLRGLRSKVVSLNEVPHSDAGTVFYRGVAPSAGASANRTPETSYLLIDADYAHLRTLGVGLPPTALSAVKAAHMAVVGRIANFPGVTAASARAVLDNLKAAGASLVIFNGDDVLGYRGLEKEVANMLREPGSPPLTRDDPADPAAEAPPTGLIYGAVEFSKQRGDELLSTTMHGDYVRVHSIQTAELATLDESEVIDRFVRAARERNIRFCYIRLFTTAGADAVDRNVEMLHKISRGIEHGAAVTGGGMEFGLQHNGAKPFADPKQSNILYALIGLSVAAGIVWMLRELCPVPRERLLLLGLTIVCVALAVLGESGRRVAALLAGIAFPAAACLRMFPRPAATAAEARPQSPRVCITRASGAVLHASCDTALGIVAVAGLLASRPFMLRTSQFLGIKAQHAIPILIVAFAALVGGVRANKESWARYRSRATAHLQRALNEPARYGMLLLGIVALAALLLIVARTGNDAGVGVSATELKARALMDRIFPVRPRTKEALVGHPAFMLALAWWWRGRRRLALPCFVVGSIGQVSLLNTFCHIHTPLIISLWHGGLGILIGIVLGAVLFLALEKLLPPPDVELKDTSAFPPRDRNGAGITDEN